MRLAVVTDDRAYGDAVCRSLLIGNRGFEITLFGCTEFCRKWKESLQRRDSRKEEAGAVAGGNTPSGTQLAGVREDGAQAAGREFPGARGEGARPAGKETAATQSAGAGAGGTELVGAKVFPDAFDLILWDWEELEEIYGGKIVRLTERRPESLVEESGEETGRGAESAKYQIWKYASSTEMTAAVFAIYEALTGFRSAGARPADVEVIAFSSWQGGCGCSLLAFAAGQELTQVYRRRVLILSLEGIESSAEYMRGADAGSDSAAAERSGPSQSKELSQRGQADKNDSHSWRLPQRGQTDRADSASMDVRDRRAEALPYDGGSFRSQNSQLKGMGEYLYRLLMANTLLPGAKAGQAPFLEEYLLRDGYGLQVFAPSSGRNPLADLSGEDMSRLLTALLSSGRFDTVILDVGTAAGEAAAEALLASDRICMVSVREEPKREQRYRSFLRYGVGEETEDRLIRIHNRAQSRALPEEGDRSGTRSGDRNGVRVGEWSGSGSGDRNGIRSGDGAGSGFRMDSWEGNREVYISERVAADSRLLLEGEFGKDIHQMVELWYNNQDKC